MAWKCDAEIDGGVCGTENPEDAPSCKYCGAPKPGTDAERQGSSTEDTSDAEENSTNEDSDWIDDARSAAEKLGDKAKEKAEEYQPQAEEAAEKAQQAAGEFQEQTKAATQTGIAPKYIVLFCFGLLMLSIALPLLLSWNYQLNVEAQASQREASSGSEYSGMKSETLHIYESADYRGIFEPLETEPGLAAVTVASAPLTVIGSELGLASSAGISESSAGTSSAIQGSASAGLSVSNPVNSLLFAGIILMLLLAADLLIGDIWAMQKLLASMVLVWLAYALVVGIPLQFFLKSIVTSSALSNADISLGLSLQGFYDAPFRIAMVGLLYWGGSYAVRNYWLGHTSLNLGGHQQ